MPITGVPIIFIVVFAFPKFIVLVPDAKLPAIVTIPANATLFPISIFPVVCAWPNVINADDTFEARVHAVDAFVDKYDAHAIEPFAIRL